MQHTAPIVLFVYNRPIHTHRTISALRSNNLAKNSDLIVFSDGAKSPSEAAAIDTVRALVSATDGFRSVRMLENKSNHGLSRSIVEGVTDVISEHGKCIVLEDDIVTSPSFLSFINAALEHYETRSDIWHISGWNYPMAFEDRRGTFLWRLMTCWGWATWDDRWKHFEKDPDKLISSFSADDIRRFNLDNGHNFWGQVLANRDGKTDTWAVFWYATIFRNRGLCLNPNCSFLDNIGDDGTGTHCLKEKTHLDIETNNVCEFELTDSRSESREAVEQFRRLVGPMRRPLLDRTWQLVRRNFDNL